MILLLPDDRIGLLKSAHAQRNGDLAIPWKHTFPLLAPDRQIRQPASGDLALPWEQGCSPRSERIAKSAPPDGDLTLPWEQGCSPRSERVAKSALAGTGI